MLVQSEVSEERLRRWLMVLRHPDKLASAEIEELLRAHDRVPESAAPLAVGSAAAELILDAIDRLRPPDDAPKEMGLPHQVLHTCFVDGAKLFQAAACLGLSERQLSRERSRAIGLLKAELENPRSRPPRTRFLPEPIPRIGDFLERPHEMARLRQAIEGSKLVVVHGPPGIGKTSLVAEFAAEVAKLAPVLWFRFRPGLNTSIVAVLFELAEHLREHGRPDLSDYLQGALKDADAALAARLAIQGLGNDRRLIVLDDYQLVEEDTSIAGFLEELAERLPEIGIAVMSRHSYLGMSLGAGMEVGSLQLGEARELFATLDVDCDADTLVKLHRWTEGNPHLLTLAASWLKTADPDHVAEGVRSLGDQAEVQAFLLSQVTRLIDPDDRIILDGASVFRSRFGDDALAHIVGRTRGAVLDASFRLVRCYAATRNRDGDSAFFHQSVRDYVYDRIETVTKATYHTRAAEWFTKNGSRDEARYHLRRASELMDAN